jgi:hypothetical protein
MGFNATAGSKRVRKMMIVDSIPSSLFLGPATPQAFWISPDARDYAAWQR